jgi:hypothetical protein
MSEIFSHRSQIKAALYAQQKGRCALSGIRTNSLEMHEWLVARSDYPIKRDQVKIFHPINCVLITRYEHESAGMDRDYRCLLFKLKTYSVDEMQEWLNSISLRTFGTLESWIFRHEARLSIPAEGGVWKKK